MTQKRFSDISLDDPFFDSLKSDYKEFPKWFMKKAGEQAYVMERNGAIEAFLYLKVENGPVKDVVPVLPPARRLKVGTMKINPHGTRLGERFIKKIFDFAMSEGVDEIYVTIFRKHSSLIELLGKYGFVHSSVKPSPNGEEQVLVKSLGITTDDLLLDYPRVNLNGHRAFLLSIYPEFHTRLFPDSILRSETFDSLEDVSHTNSIHKIYVCFMPGVAELQKGDLLVIYRTSDKKGPAWYRSVATSICVVDELKSKKDFANEHDFVSYCRDYSVFSETELREWYNDSRKKNVFAIKMTYNIAMRTRLNRGKLIEDVGLGEDSYWGIMPISELQFLRIVKAGGIDESFIVH